MTPLDSAVAGLKASPDDTAARLRFFDLFATAELFVMLETEPTGDSIVPVVFDLPDGAVALAFDTESRLAEFAQGAQAFAVLSGRQIASLFSGQNLRLGLNLGAGSEMIVSRKELHWLDQSVSETPQEVQGRPIAVAKPLGVPEVIITALDARLAGMTGLASMAFLVGMEFDTGARGHMLVFVDALITAQEAMAQSVQEALALSGVEAAALDVMFLDASHPLAADLARYGLRFDLPQMSPRSEPQAPGMDRAKPPKLR